MVRRAVLVMVVVVVVVSLASTTSSTYTKTSTFCREETHGFTCDFFNTTQDVVTGDGRVTAEVASQHPAISCPATLDVNKDSSIPGKPATPDQPHATHSSPNRTMANVTRDHPLSSRREDGEPGASTTLGEPQHQCAVNVSIQDSTVHLVQGYFVAARLLNSKIEHLKGNYIYLYMKNTVVNNISLSGRMVGIVDSKMLFVSQLKVERQLHLYNSHLGTVAPGGLLFFPPGREEASTVHTVHNVVVQRLETGSLQVMRANVNITNTSMRWLARDAIMVRSPGHLTMTNTVLHCDPLYYCLNLGMGARLVLKNVTIRNRTITKLDLVATSKGNMYPLFALVAMDDRAPLTMTFPWYWVVAMTVCGIVAGIVIGSAIVWKRPSLSNRPMFNFTLADLLSHDRMQENNMNANRNDHTEDLSQQPTLTRQDSGLTSSSFASYKLYQGSRTDVEGGVSSSYTNTIQDDT